MPSSANHCSECLFSQVAEADEGTTFLEERHVEGQLLAISGDTETGPIDMSRGDLASERIVAAHGCAKILSEGGCDRYVSFVVHGGNNTAKAFILERDEYEAE